MVPPLLSRWVLVPFLLLLLSGGTLASFRLSGSAVGASSEVRAPSTPQLRVRFPGHPGCQYDLKPSGNHGRPTAVTCLIDGNGFTSHHLVRLSYGFAIPQLPLAPNDEPTRGAAQALLTPLPHVQCLMHQVSRCRLIAPDAHGHFGPVWVRLIYLQGDRDQFFTLRADGGPNNRASLRLPYSRLMQ
jgi:hypothetical protein